MLDMAKLIYDPTLYYIPINYTTFELSVFWSYDTESRINELRFSDSYHYPLKEYSVQKDTLLRTYNVIYLFLRRRYEELISSIEPETENMMT